MNNMMSSWQFWACLSAVLAAATAIFAKAGVEHIDPDVAAFIRTIVIVAVLGLVLAVTAGMKRPSTWTSRGVLFLVLSGLAAAGSWFCYFRALKLGDAGRVAPIDKMSLVLVALFAAAFLGERLSAAGWFGIVLIVIGAVLVSTTR